MLILTRRVNETLNIGDEVQVTVLGVKGNQVQIGVKAPKRIPVHREEIYERIKKEREAAGAIFENTTAHKVVFSDAEGCQPGAGVSAPRQQGGHR